MKTIVLLALCGAMTLPGCGDKKKPEAAGNGPAKASTGAAAPGETTTANDPAASPGDPGAAAAPEGTGGAAPGTPGQAPADKAPEGGEPNKAPAAPAKPVVKDRLDVPTLPKPNSEGFFMIMQQAATSCRPADTQCAPVAQLAARIPAELEEISKLAKKGTDQQKSAIRKALLLSDHAPAIPLLLSFAVDRAGQLDMDVIEHAVALRAAELVPVMRKRLDKAVGTDARSAVVAMGRLGLETAHGALKEALKVKSAQPFLGDVCQALARTGAIDAADAVKGLGSRLDGSRRQREGCRNAEAAFRMLKLPTAATLFLDSKQYQRLGVVAEQRTPRSVTLVVTDKPNATCADRGQALVEIAVPLTWNGEPIVGKPVVPTVHVGKDTLGADAAYFARLDALELKAGSKLAGIGFFSHVPVKGSHRLVMQGSFEGTYCGAK